MIMTESQHPSLDGDFVRALDDINGIMSNAGQLAGLGNSLVNLHNSQQEYKRVQHQLQTVIIQREVIMRIFDTVDDFIRVAYEERADVLKKADILIREGLKKKKQDKVLVGLQIIKAVLLTNPFNKTTIDLISHQAASELLNTNIV
jgi:hypothetical protein